MVTKKIKKNHKFTTHQAPENKEKPFNFDTVLNLDLKSERCHLLCHSALIMTRSPFSNAVTFEKHNPTLFSYHRWKRIQRNNRANTAHLQNITSSLPKKWQWPKNRRPTVAICPSDCDDGKSIFGHHISPLYTGRQFFRYYWGQWWKQDDTGVFSYIFFIFLKTKNKKKRKRGGEEKGGGGKDWSVLPPTELHLPNGLLLGANWAWK